MSNEVETELYSKLVKIAGQIVLGRDFISPIAEDHSGRTPRSIIAAAQKQQSIMKDWAYEIRQVANALIRTRTSADYIRGIEDAAKVAENLKGGYSCDVMDGTLDPDPDGPWHLGSDVAKAIRASLPSEPARHPHSDHCWDGQHKECQDSNCVCDCHISARTKFIREQQRNPSSEVTAVMVSPSLPSEPER